MGANGSGKTSVLEAVHLLGTTLSFRTRRDGDLVRSGAAAARVLGLGEGLRHEIRLGSEREHLRDGERVARGELLGSIPVTPLLPGDLEILQGDPAGRRRFLDLLLAQRERGHGARLLRLRRIERQRRTALAAGADARPWARALAQAAPDVIRARVAGAAELAPLFAACGARLFEGKKPLALALRGPAALAEASAESVTEILGRVEAEEARDRRPAWTSDRWDLDVALDGRPIARFGSQGELRAAAVALRLASQRFLGAEKGVLLVDDVWGELDSSRRAALAEALAQTPSQTLFAVVEIGVLPAKIQGLSRFSFDENSSRIRA